MFTSENSIRYFYRSVVFNGMCAHPCSSLLSNQTLDEVILPSNTVNAACFWMQLFWCCHKDTAIEEQIMTALYFEDVFQYMIFLCFVSYNILGNSAGFLITSANDYFPSCTDFGLLKRAFQPSLWFGTKTLHNCYSNTVLIPHLLPAHSFPQTFPTAIRWSVAPRDNDWSLHRQTENCEHNLFSSQKVITAAIISNSVLALWYFTCPFRWFWRISTLIINCVHLFTYKVWPSVCQFEVTATHLEGLHARCPQICVCSEIQVKFVKYVVCMDGMNRIP